MKFTKASVATLTLPAGKLDHFEWDSATPGFGIRLRGNRRTWVAQIRVDGRTRRMAIGNVAQIELEPARTAAKRFFAQATLGGDPLKDRAVARVRASRTVGSVVDRYLAAMEPHWRPNSKRAVARYLLGYFAPLHRRPIDSVARVDVADLISDLAKEHGLVAAARARSALHSLFVWAMKQGLCEGNPVAATNDPAPDEAPRSRTLAPAEIRTVWAVLPETNLGRIVKLLFYTACRRIEIGSMEWAEVDFDKTLLTIPASKTKNHRQHRLPLVPEAIEILRSVPRTDSPFVFGGRRGFTGWSYAIAELRACLSATEGMADDWSLHDVRRTVRSEMGELGVEPWVAEQILNHARAGIEATYNWSKLERQMRMALGMWAERLRAILEDTESNVVAIRA